MRLYLLLLVGCVLVQLVLPWWSVVVVCLAGGYALGKTGGGSWSAGFLAVAVGWALAAVIKWMLTGSVLPDRVATLLGAPGGGGVVVVIAAVLGGLAGGVAALTGWWLRVAFGKERPMEVHAKAD